MRKVSLWTGGVVRYHLNILCSFNQKQSNSVLYFLRKVSTFEKIQTLKDLIFHIYSFTGENIHKKIQINYEQCLLNSTEPLNLLEFILREIKIIKNIKQVGDK